MENPVLVHQETGDPQGTLHPWPAERDSRQAIQTWPDHQMEWSLHPEVFKTICYHWHQPQVDLFATRFNNKWPGMGSRCTQPLLGGPGSICLSTTSHLGQSNGKATGLPLQQDDPDCTRVALHALVLGSGSNLVAMGSGKRRSEIHAWLHRNIRHQSDWSKVSLYPSPSFLSKNQLVKECPDSVASVVIPALVPSLDKSLKGDRSLCPVRALRYYLDRTSDLRQNK